MIKRGDSPSWQSAKHDRGRQFIRKLAHCFCVRFDSISAESDGVGAAELSRHLQDDLAINSERSGSAVLKGDASGVFERSAPEKIKSASTDTPHDSVPKDHPAACIVPAPELTVHETQNNNQFQSHELKKMLSPNFAQSNDTAVSISGDENKYCGQANVRNNVPLRQCSARDGEGNLDPVLFAAEDVALASRLLSSVLNLLKQQVGCNIERDEQASTAAHYIQSSSMEDLIHRLPVEKIPKLNHLCATDTLPLQEGSLHDLPSFDNERQIPSVSVVIEENEFHYASKDIRIYVEDSDPIEPVIPLTRNSCTEDELDILNHLAPIVRDNSLKSQCPITWDKSRHPSAYTSTVRVAKQLYTTLPTDSHSAWQTIVTTTFQPFSTEETQVTEVDDALPTDESDPSELLGIDSIRNHSEKISAMHGFMNLRQYHTQTDQGASPTATPMATVGASTVSWDGLAKSNDSNAGLRYFQANTERPSTRSDKDFAFKHQVDENKRVVSTAMLPPETPNAEKRREEYATRHPVVLDADDLSFEVLCQYSNHNGMLTGVMTELGQRKAHCPQPSVEERRNPRNLKAPYHQMYFKEGFESGLDTSYNSNRRERVEAIKSKPQRVSSCPLRVGRHSLLSSKSNKPKLRKLALLPTLRMEQMGSNMFTRRSSKTNGQPLTDHTKEFSLPLRQKLLANIITRKRSYQMRNVLTQNNVPSGIPAKSLASVLQSETGVLRNLDKPVSSVRQVQAAHMRQSNAGLQVNSPPTAKGDRTQINVGNIEPSVHLRENTSHSS
ncbi:unnamed protein product [Dicrocoelium dendriticum]|nr:unnamed protein product [Dicrocoelium dendriticum]